MRHKPYKPVIGATAEQTEAKNRAARSVKGAKQCQARRGHEDHALAKELGIKVGDIMVL